MRDARDVLIELLRLVDRTADHEIDCEEFLHRSAGLIEALVEARERPEGWSQLVQHLRVCSECEEEFEATLRALEHRE